MNLFEENPNVHGNLDPILAVPVNNVGVMGKGMAKQAKDYFPLSSELYRAQAVLMSGGDVLYFQEATPLYGGVLFVATKEDWRAKSRIEWIDKAAQHIRTFLVENPAVFLYIPPLGAGLGGLPLGHVRYVIEQTLREFTDRYMFVLPEKRER